MAATKEPRMATTDTVPERWRSLFALIPKYDPDATRAGGEWFDGTAADRALEFFAAGLKHIEGKFAGQPFVLEPWQQAIVGCIFGWKRADGSRRYREVMLGVPRGNGKTPLAAGICLYVLFCDNEPGAQIYGAAAEVAQASLLFRQVRGMVERAPALARGCVIVPSTKSIILKSDPASTYRVVSSDAGGKHGYNPQLIIDDELHAWEGRDLIEAFQSAFAKKGRRQPLWLHITTRDFDRPSVCNEKWKYAEDVRAGICPDSAFLPVLYQPDESDTWTDERTWEKCNPNIDVSVDRVSLRRLCEQAKANPAIENTFKRLHLNARTEQDMRVIRMDAWDASAETFTLGDMSGQRCFVGLDLSSKDDLTSVGLVFPQEDDRCRVTAFSFCPEERVKVRAQKNIPYNTWARQGHITATTGNKIDYRVIRSFIRSLRDEHRLTVLEVCYDPWGASGLEDDLQEDGFTVVPVPQSLTAMSPPTKEFLRRLGDDKLRHDGNPVLRWAASNAGVHYQGKLQIGADLTDIVDRVPIMFSKQTSADKIDPVQSIVLAFKGLIEHPEQWGTSVYNHQPEGAMVL